MKPVHAKVAPVVVDEAEMLTDVVVHVNALGTDTDWFGLVISWVTVTESFFIQPFAGLVAVT